MFDKVLQEIINHDSIVIFGHIHPDGDCYGSQIALRDSIKLKYPNKQVFAVGSGVRRFLDYIGQMDVIEDEVIKQSLAILVDANDLSRMEDQRIVNAKAWIKFDHHVDNGTFTEGPFVVNEKANSCCEIVTDFLTNAKFPFNETIANALFLGIVTDTGKFQYISDFPKAFRQAAKLCEYGARPDKLNRILNNTYEASMAFKGFVFSNYQKTENGVIYLLIDKNTLEKFNLTPSKAGSMVNLISNIDGYPIWAFFCEQEDGSNHAEFRSNGPHVQPIAAKYGGGGHLLAAGVTLPDSKEETINNMILELDNAAKAYKEGK
jgi:phosphoesterase RecJ-like protein